MSHEVNIQAALESVSEFERSASSAAFEAQVAPGGEWFLEDMASRDAHRAFLELLVIAEAAGLPELRKMIQADYVAARRPKDGGLGACLADPNDEPYLVCGGTIRSYCAVLEGAFGLSGGRAFKRDLEQILRGLEYALTDKKCFDAPQNEQDVKDRSEMILKCVFPDLLRSPGLSKPIKNFFPDTGIPSLRTLIEYKFISDEAQVGPISDQILADTRGYTSSQWNNFVYVIYETKRFKPESVWRTHLRECGTAANTEVIVICGEPPPAKTKEGQQGQGQSQSPQDTRTQVNQEAGGSQGKSSS